MSIRRNLICALIAAAACLSLLPVAAAPAGDTVQAASTPPAATATRTPRPTSTRTLTPRPTSTRTPRPTSTPTRTSVPRTTAVPAGPTPTPVPYLQVPWANITAASSWPMDRVLFANYYAWFDANTWTTGITPDQPPQPYISADSSVMERHIRQAQDAGIDAFNLAWLGPGNPTDSNLAMMLPIAASRGFALTIGFETDSPFYHSRRDFVLALRYALANYAAQPGYLRIDGKPVVFFWRLRAIPLGGAESALDAWRAVRAEVDPYGQALWIAEGDRFEFLEVFDGIYPYSIAWADDVGRILRLYGSRTRRQQTDLGARKLWVATVMPGYNDLTTGRSDAFTRDRVNGSFYAETWDAALSSNPDWIMITSWNEWVEGSQIEPSRTYREQYLTATLDAAFRWRSPPPDAAFAEAELAEATTQAPAPGEMAEASSEETADLPQSGDSAG